MIALVLMLTQIDAGPQEIQRRLASMRIDVDFAETPLADALAVVRAHTGTNLILDPAVAPDHESEPVTMKLRGLPVRTVLKLMLEPRRLTVAYRQGVLVIVPPDHDRRLVTKVYDVRDLLFPIQHFAGPRVELVSPEDGGIVVGGDFFDPPRRETIAPEVLTQIIPQATGGKDGWTAHEDVGISLVNNMLVVTQSESVHREVAGLLRLLRQY